MTIVGTGVSDKIEWKKFTSAALAAILHTKRTAKGIDSLKKFLSLSNAQNLFIKKFTVVEAILAITVDAVIERHLFTR